MNKKNTIITDWLDKHGDPQIEKKVMERLDKITKELIIDEVYENYRNAFIEGHIHEELDKCLSKEEFIEEIKTNPEFSENWGLKIEERELSLDERYKIALPIWKEKYGLLANMMVPTNVDNTPYKIPTKLITIKYNDKTIENYE
jgi:hypothetical protein